MTGAPESNIGEKLSIIRLLSIRKYCTVEYCCNTLAIQLSENFLYLVTIFQAVLQS